MGRDARMTAGTAPLHEGGHAAVTAVWHLQGLNLEERATRPGFNRSFSSLA
ncbi:hypothetical protein D187_009823 [Cystobacter fuscus DSM 2262]|uniref:Uncharacterized protein n=1 Tax=Cystobacter fuscus (strain ATCC 25194 / DSM 2262 / NBRC 100088 / M29) TaxID=1242864 RepID=S9Q892_CYSF2|nr:hypothetical protein D187_009823 [Cystobacter fuscus DSM 2262]